MASTQPSNSNFPHFPPPPPFQPFHLPPPPPPPSHPFAPPPASQPPRPPPPRPIISPPPPHVRPPPAPVPPSPSPNNHPIVIVVVFVSLGGLLFLSLLAFALFCFVQRRKKKTRETEIIHIDEHKKVKEAIVSGPFGQRRVVLSVEDDVHIDEEIKKNEKSEHGLHAKPSADEGNINTSSQEVGTTSSAFDHHHHHQLEHRP